MERRGRTLTELGKHKLSTARLQERKSLQELCALRGIHIDAKTIRASMRDQPVDVATWQKIFDAYGLDLQETADLQVGAGGTLVGNLPYPPSIFVGRQAEVDRIHRELESEQIVSVTGSGGSGKTTLAKVSLRAWSSSGPIWFISLKHLPLPHADVQPAELEQRLCELICEQLRGSVADASAPHEPSIAELGRFLRRPGTVLVLDNCEHMLHGVRLLLSQLTLRCPDLKVLCTSRKRLGIDGECVIRLGPLGLPKLRKGADSVRAVRESEAGGLFEQLAARSVPEFCLDEANAAHVVDICRHLGGVPRSIEIASRLIAAWSVADMAEAVTKFVANDLREFFEWSFSLLSGPEQTLLARLSVFVGGWTREAAVAVCSDAGGSGQIGNEDLPRLLLSLADWDLVKYDPELDRYEMLEPDRQFTADMFMTIDGDSRLRERHLQYFMYIANTSPQEDRDPIRLDRLEADHENLREALRFLTAGGRIEGAMSLAGSLTSFWAIRGHFAEGARVLEQLLAHRNGPRSGKRWEGCLEASGQLAFARGDLITARQFHEECLRARRARQDMAAVSESLLFLGRIYVPQGLVREARACLLESYRIKRSLLDDPTLPGCLVHLGRVARLRGRLSQALRYQKAGLAIAASRGDGLREAWHMSYLGSLYRDLGDLENAEEIHRRAEAVFRRHGDSGGVAWSILDLGFLAKIRGESDEASHRLHEALEMFEELQNADGIAGAKWYLGLLALDEGKREKSFAYLSASLHGYRAAGSMANVSCVLEALILLAAASQAETLAARLAGIVHTLRLETMILPTYYGWERVDRCLDGVREHLGADAFTAEWREGCAMPRDEALNFATKGLARIPSP